jgi:hypothetical protein
MWGVPQEIVERQLAHFSRLEKLEAGARGSPTRRP